MSGELQLERSILESKERGELQAIALAMSLKPSSRLKKADIIDQILDAAGVGGGNGDGKVPARSANGARKSNSKVSIAGEVSESFNGASDYVATESDTSEKTADRKVVRTPRANPALIAMAAQETGSIDLDDDFGESNPSEVTRSAPSTDISTNERGREKAEDSGDEGSEKGTGEPRSGDQDRGQPRSQPRPNNNQNRDPNEMGGRKNRRRRGRDGARPRTDRENQGQNEVPYDGEPIPVQGLLDLREEGYGFLRTSGYLPSNKDVYVSLSQARKFSLRKGDYLEGASRPAASNEKYPALLRVDSINGKNSEDAKMRPKFEDLTPLFPDEKLKLEVPGDAANMTARIVDLLSPIGKGQRGLIVSPPKAGKTSVMKQIAHSIEVNNPDVHLMVLLVDERPEEVTDMRRSVNGEVIASTFDRPSDEHTMVAELAIERAKRLVENKKDVVIILDGITRLARAYNLAQPTTGRVMSGGVDSGALYPPKKFFGAARNIEEGGSLTILATALVETGSKMDEVIFEEFKGTGNMELRLDRRLAERRIYPAIDVNASSTRHEELLFERLQLQQVWKLRRVLTNLASDGNSAPGLELLMDKIKTTTSNDQFLAEIAKNPTP